MQSYTLSLREALQAARTNIYGQGTVYYRKDGNLAVYDVISPTEASAFVNGRALCLEGKPVYSVCWQTAIRYFQLKRIDLSTGWSTRPSGQSHSPFDVG